MDRLLGVGARHGKPPQPFSAEDGAYVGAARITRDAPATPAFVGGGAGSPVSSPSVRGHHRDLLAELTRA